jgi:hypothetical protein
VSLRASNRNTIAVGLSSYTPLPLRLDAPIARAPMPIRSFIPYGAFEPAAIAAMSEALEAACKQLQDTGRPEIARDVLAGRIIAAARLGERDPVRLREAALARLTGKRDQHD